jgi:hypothetical protein
MSESQIDNFRMIRNLLRQLRGFGLNPRHWRLVRHTNVVHPSEFALANRHDEEFRLRATVVTERSRAKLVTLSLVSL